jgi:hypothetical protein
LGSQLQGVHEGGEIPIPLDVRGQPAVAVDPGEEPLDHPARCVDGDADLAFGFTDDLDPDRTCSRDTTTLLACIRVGHLHERPAWARGTQQRPGPVSVLDVGRMGLELMRPAIGIDQRMPLATLDPLAGMVAPDAAALGRLDALAVHHGRCRAGLAAGALAVARNQVMVGRNPRAVSAWPSG